MEAELPDLNAMRTNAFWQILQQAAHVRRAEISEHLMRLNGGKVVSGPFAGMVLAPTTSWGVDGETSPKILGCYEEELHRAIETAIKRNPVTAINIGCAEGYYAVGMARRLPEARVFAHDIDEAALQVCREASAANGVADRLTVGGRCTPEMLRELFGRGEAGLAIIDCEGGEFELLDSTTLSALRRVDVIVECHDFIDRRITPTLVELFKATHDVEVIREGPRNPNAFSTLQRWSSLDRWLSVCEFRPEQMGWLACWAR
jgi:hypothetical protein